MNGLLGMFGGGQMGGQQMPGQQQQPAMPRGSGGLLGAYNVGGMNLPTPMSQYGRAHGSLPTAFYSPFTPAAQMGGGQGYTPTQPAPAPQQAMPDIDQMVQYFKRAMGTGFDAGAFRVQAQADQMRPGRHLSGSE